MPIQYICRCGEEQLLPDSKSGQLCSCTRCRLKFVAPPPNLVPTGGAPHRPTPAAAPRPGVGPAPVVPPRPVPGARPAMPPPAAVRPPAPAPSPMARPPLYPIEESTAGKKSPIARPTPAPAPQPPVPRSLEESSEGSALFGVSMRQQGGKLFGEDADEVEVGELFADPTSREPSANDPLEAAAAAVAGAPEDELVVPDDDEATDAGTALPAAAPADLISMDELFAPEAGAPPRAPAASSPPPFGQMSQPFLKPIEPPRAAPGPAPTGTGSGPFTLVSVEGVPDAVYNLPGGGNYLIGRDKDAEVKILSTSVSRKHARIDATGKDAVLIDLGSANGTQVNGTSINRHALREGDLIKVGKVVLRFKR